MSLCLHGTCVALNGRALLLLGPSGSGKSSLALQLMAFGADLVSDDQTQLTREGDSVVATAPSPIAGLIEARTVGLLRADVCEKATLYAIVKLDIIETERLPPKRCMDVLSVAVPVLHKSEGIHFAAALLQYLKGGALDPDDHP